MDERKELVRDPNVVGSNPGRVPMNFIYVLIFVYVDKMIISLFIELKQTTV